MNTIRTRRGGVLAGCLVVLVVVLVLCGIGGYWVYVNGRAIVADGVSSALIEAVEDTELSNEQKAAIRQEIDDLTADFKSGDVTLKQLVRVGEELGESPLLHVGAIYFVEHEYIEPADLDDEQKAEARLSIHRFARGVHEETIPVQKIDDVMDPISEIDADGDRSLKEDVTPEDLLAFAAAAKMEADAAGVPEELFTVDLAAEIGMAIDRALGREAEVATDADFNIEESSEEGPEERPDEDAVEPSP